MLRRFYWVFAFGPLLNLAGCSDPVPASAAVGLTLNISNTAGCPTEPGMTDDLGNPAPDSTRPAVGPGKRVYNGENGISVSCTVSGNGPYTVSASVTSQSPRVSFGVNGNIDASGTGTAQISMSTPVIGRDSVTSPNGSPCTLEVISTTQGLQVKPGAIWARFNCEVLQANPSPVCRATGEFILENCSK